MNLYFYVILKEINKKRRKVQLPNDVFIQFHCSLSHGGHRDLLRILFHTEDTENTEFPTE